MCAALSNKSTLLILILHRHIGSASSGLQVNLTEDVHLDTEAKELWSQWELQFEFLSPFQG